MKKILLLICLITVFLSLIPDIYRLRQTPPNTVFPLIHNHPEDYFYYLSLMKQGAEGQIMLTSRMTPESFPAALAHTFYALLGHLSRISGLSLVIVYFLSRILLGFLLLASTFYLAAKIFTRSQDLLLACILISINSGFFFISNTGGKIVFHQFFSFWTRFNPLIRTTYIPHHLFSTILGLLSLYLLAKSIDLHNRKFTHLSSLCGFVSALVYFATMTNILGGLITAFCLIIIFNRQSLKKSTSFALSGSKRVTEARYLVDVTFNPAQQQGGDGQALRGTNFIFFLTVFIEYFLISGLALLYIFSLSKGSFPWSGYSKVAEKFTFGFKIWEYLAALGPLLIFTFIGLPAVLKKHSPLLLFLLGWLLFPIIGIPLSRIFLPIYGDVYFLEATSYIPLGILAVFGFKQIKRIFNLSFAPAKNSAGGTSGRDPDRHPAEREEGQLATGPAFDKESASKVFVVLIILTITYFLLAIFFSLKQELLSFRVDLYNNYIPVTVFDGFNWLENNTPKESIVLAGGFFGNIIPAYTHNKVVYGHPAGTYNSPEKMNDAYKVFSLTDMILATAVLKKYHVDYVFYSLDTDPPNDDIIKKLNLLLVYKNQTVSIYQVKKYE